MARTVTGLADPARVLAALDDGATLVLQGLHRFWEPLRHFVRGLETSLGHTCQVNAYFTPPGAQGLKVHSDSHDVFVLQAFGSKRWEIHAPDGVWDLVLEPGDTLYMPKGTPHAATAQDVLSGHLTIGILTTSWREAITGVVRDVLADDAFDDRLPAGWHTDPTTARAELLAHLDDLRARLEKVDLDAALDESRRPVLDQAAAHAGRWAARPDPPQLTSATRRSFAAGPARCAGSAPPRPACACSSATARSRCPRGSSPQSSTSRAVSRSAWATSALDEQSRQVLVRRLVREGLLEVVE